MKRITVLILFILTISFNCERDDICPESTPTTPRLMMSFFNLENPDEAKSVTNLRIEVTGSPDMVLPDYQGSGSTNSIILPLKTTGNMTSYTLIKEYSEDSDGNPNGGNPDVITFSYETEEVYVSRACGYKTIFKNVTVNLETDTDKWIELIQTVNDNQSIEDETTTHFKLLH